MAKQQLFKDKYSLDQALVLARKVSDNIPNKLDLLKALSSDNSIEFHCYARNLPLLIELIETTYEEGKGTIGTPIGYEINCYTGFFNLSLSDCREGANFISDLAHDRENEGVISIEGLDWEECESLVADLDKIKGFENGYFDCEGAKSFSKDIEPFEYVPTKHYQPTIEQLYVDKPRFDYWLKERKFLEMTDGVSLIRFWQDVFARGNHKNWQIDGEKTTKQAEDKMKTWALKWKKPPEDLDTAIIKVRGLIESCNPETKTNKELFKGSTELEIVYEKVYLQLQKDFFYIFNFDGNKETQTNKKTVKKKPPINKVRLELLKIWLNKKSNFDPFNHSKTQEQIWDACIKDHVSKSVRYKFFQTEANELISFNSGRPRKPI